MPEPSRQISIKEEWQLSPRKLLTKGDPVKLAGKRGLYRFVEVYTFNEAWYAVVIGPIGKVEIGRIVPVDQLRSAGKATREQVAMSADVKQISENAKQGKRK